MDATEHQMEPTLELIETTSSSLWDYGWFDRSRFRISRPTGPTLSSSSVLADLLRSPLFSRGFCALPDPWGCDGREHGPWALDRVGPSHFRALTAPELKDRVRSIFNAPNFTRPPSDDQQVIVYNWLDELSRRRAELFVLEPPEAAAGSLASAGIWLLFNEFIAVDLSGREVSIGVIGYD